MRFDVVGDAVGAQPGQGVLPGVAVEIEPLGDGGGADGGVGVEQLGDERGDLVARDLVLGVPGPAGFGCGVPGAARLERFHRVVGPVLGPVRLDAGLDEGGVVLVRLPGVGGYPDQGRALAAVQEIAVVLALRQRGDGLAEGVGVDLFAVVQPRPGPLRVDRLREAGGVVGLESGVVVDADPLLRGEVRARVRTRCCRPALITGVLLQNSLCRKTVVPGAGPVSGTLRVGPLRGGCLAAGTRATRPRGRAEGAGHLPSCPGAVRTGPARPRQFPCRGRAPPGVWNQADQPIEDT